MKKVLFILAFTGLIVSSLQAQVSKTMSVVPGGLYKALTFPERGNVTDLILTGSIDAQDFKTMRDAMPNLSVVDLSKVSIVAYTGTAGTESNGKKASYKANTIPQFAFFSDRNGSGKRTITNVIFPKKLAGIGEKAFWSCFGLTGTVLPATVISLGAEAFYNCKAIMSITVNNPEPIKDMGKGVFYAVDPSTCILHVPTGSKDAFQSAKQWQDFMNIQDDVAVAEPEKK